jgi:hypothetical protein
LTPCAWGYARAKATVVLPAAGPDVRVTIVMRVTPLRLSTRQDRVSGGEVDVATDASTLVGINVGWMLIRGGILHLISLRADNLLNAEYRDATSWIKRFARNPGHNAAVVYRVMF